MNKWVESMNRAINILQEQIKEHQREQRIQDQQITIDRLWVDRWACMYFTPRLDTRFLKITNPHKDITATINIRLWDPIAKTKKWTSVCLIEPESEVIYYLSGNPVLDGRYIRLDFEKVDPLPDDHKDPRHGKWYSIYGPIFPKEPCKVLITDPEWLNFKNVLLEDGVTVGEYKGEAIFMYKEHPLLNAALHYMLIPPFSKEKE